MFFSDFSHGITPLAYNKRFNLLYVVSECTSSYWAIDLFISAVCWYSVRNCCQKPTRPHKVANVVYNLKGSLFLKKKKKCQS